MKKLMMFVFAAFVYTTAATAQDSSAAPKMHHDKMKMMKDCVMMEGGKMMMMKDGKSMPMDKDVTMSNGTVVMADGSVKMQDGTTKKLSDGDCVFMDGKIKNKMHKKDKPAGQ